MQPGDSDAGQQGIKAAKPKKPKVDAYLQAVPDRKLKGQLKHKERLYKESNKEAAQINTWLAPADAGFLETEGVCVWVWLITQVPVTQLQAAVGTLSVGVPGMGNCSSGNHSICSQCPVRQ